MPGRIAAVVFDVGNTLHHIDHAFIAGMIAQHGFPVTAPRPRQPPYAARSRFCSPIQFRSASGHSS